MLQENITAEQLEKAKTTQSLEELKAMAQAEGVEAPDEQIALLWQELSGQEGATELADDVLESVAGGCGPKEYDVQGIDPPACPGGKYYSQCRSRFKGKTKCCNCMHFTPNTPGNWAGPGKCRR